MKAVIKLSMTEPVAKALVTKARMKTLHEAPWLEISEVPWIEPSAVLKSGMGTKEAMGLVTLYEAVSTMESVTAMVKTRGQNCRTSQA
jgi:hypothetical protein